MRLPSVYGMVRIELVRIEMVGSEMVGSNVWRLRRPRPTAKVRTLSPCEASAVWPYAGARRHGTPNPATGAEDTDKGGNEQGSRPDGIPRGGPEPIAATCQVGTTPASGPAMSS